MTERTGDLAKRGTGGVTSGSGQVTGPAGRVAAAHGGTVVHRAVPALKSAVRGQTEAAARKELPCRMRL